MGTSDDSTQRFIVNDVRRHFPECEGWKITSRETLAGYDQVFRLQRPNGMSQEIVTLGFSFGKTVPELLLKKVRSPAVTNIPANFLRTRNALLVPDESDLSGIGNGIAIYTMKNFRYDGPALVWLKHPRERFGRIRQSIEDLIPAGR